MPYFILLECQPYQGLMTEQANEATEQAKATIAEVVALLTHYNFDLGNHAADRLVIQWLTTYPTLWVKNAVIEALYQGRYKAISVEQILMLWQRRGKPFPHHNHDFERLVCHKLPRNLSGSSQSTTFLTEPASPHAPPPAIASLVPASQALPIPTLPGDRQPAGAASTSSVEEKIIPRHPVIPSPVLPDLTAYLKLGTSLREKSTPTRLKSEGVLRSDELATVPPKANPDRSDQASNRNDTISVTAEVDVMSPPCLGTLSVRFEPSASVIALTAMPYHDLLPQIGTTDLRLNPQFYLAKWFWLRTCQHPSHHRTVAVQAIPMASALHTETDAPRSDVS